MKKHLIGIIALILTLVLCLGFVSCEGEESDIILIKGGEAKFKVVIASGAGTSARRAATAFVEELRDLGVEVDDAVTDSDETEVTDCEIIIGARVKNREDCVVNEEDVGENGYVIKAVGKRIVIAGGTSEVTKKALEIFKETYLGITEDTASLADVSVSPTLKDEFVSQYDIVSFTVNGTPISDFVIAYDYGKDENIAKACPTVASFRDDLNEATGLNMQVEELSKTSSEGHRFIIRLVSEAGKYGFRAYATEKDFVVECAYWNLFKKAFDAFAEEEIFSKTGELAFDEGYSYTYDVTTVKYSDFGAVHDGKTNDFEAIMKTHEFANQCGQKVLTDGRVTYYIGNTNYGTKDKPSIKYVTVKTDVDFGNATFLIDDQFEGAYDCRGSHIFYIERENKEIRLDEAAIKALAGTDDPQILRTYDTNGNLISGKIPWLASKLDSYSLVLLQNSNHYDYVRFGANLNEGASRTEMICVDASGNVDKTTPVTFDFTDLTQIIIYRTDDAPVTIEGGYFINKCCKAGVETNYKNKYTSFARGFCVWRSNTTMKNINHKMTDEPIRPTTGDQMNQSYPYYGFLTHYFTYNSKAISCDLTGHRTYAELRSNTNAVTQMGTYDLIVQYSIGSYFEKITQSARPIYDGAYWGMMASNYSRNMTFKMCTMSRFDAHQGFWNADLIQCNFGTDINVVGGGQLNIIGTTKWVGDSFVQLRGDYGATFEGDILIKDSTYLALNSWSSRTNSDTKFDDKDYRTDPSYIFKATVTNGSYTDGNGKVQNYYTWDFGYTCYMPQNITFDNFKSNALKLYVFNDIHDPHFISQGTGDDIYRITKKITYKNMSSTFSICPTPSTCAELAKISQVKQ